MGEFNWPIGLWSADRERLETVEALVDTGSSFSMFPEAMLRRLGHQPTAALDFEQADGRITEWPIADILLSLDGQDRVRTVIFGPNAVEPLIGADTLQGFLLRADSPTHRLIPRTGRL